MVRKMWERKVKEREREKEKKKINQRYFFLKKGNRRRRPTWPSCIFSIVVVSVEMP